MSLYAIGDLHLCLGAYKPMDVFGGRWEGYMDKLREGLSVIQSGDTTVLLGDLSWALGIEQAEKDLGNVEVDVRGANSDTDFDGQLNMVETIVNADMCEAIAIAPL